ncbi:MAG: iron-containing alcohol dehydrogenase, partial [Bacteroidales bacterium]|nr:iron-containing alcohol dehydrogenase [Bacteroidales bacterium]
MLGNFKYSNPTKLYFGNDSLKFLSEELKNYGPVVMMTYGGGSIKKNGIYDAVINILNQAGKTVIEDAGVMPNPTVEKLYEGAALAKKHNVDLILAVGGGSTIDYSKGVAASAYCEQDPWVKYYVQQQDPDCKIIPV